jgi:gluconolactonase
MTLEPITTGLRFPEGPVWLGDGSVVVVEIEAGRITRVHSDGTKQTIASPGGGPNGAALGPDGKLYVCNNGGFAWSEQQGMLFPGKRALNYSGGRIERVCLTSGQVDILYTQADGRPLKGPNDLVFDAHGGFYFTDLGKTHDDYVDHGALYYAKADGSSVHTLAYPLDHPNGVGLSPDGQTLYVALTMQRLLLAFAITAPGVLAPSAGIFPGRVVASWPGRALLDSLAVLADGDVVVATLLDQAGLTRVRPATGAQSFIPLPDPLPTNLCFGGAQHQDAYVTLSASGQLIKLGFDTPGLKLAY